MGQEVTELVDKFQSGLVNRREFVQRLIVATGSVVAASHVLSTLGFDTGVIQEARAQKTPIEETEDFYPAGKASVQYFMARPVEGGPFPTMIVIHENVGLSLFTRNVARKFAAEQGFLALAPHILPFAGRPGPVDGKHLPWMMETLETGVAVVPDDEIDALNAGFEWLAMRKDVDAQHIGSVGFCWGGARSFSFATRNPYLWAAIVFYGSTPPFEALPDITAPVLGLYGALDNQNPNSITGRAAETAREMRRLNKIFEWEVYNRAQHGFFRAAGDAVSTARPAVLAWDLLLDFVTRHYERG